MNEMEIKKRQILIQKYKKESIEEVINIINWLYLHKLFRLKKINKIPLSTIGTYIYELGKDKKIYNEFKEADYIIKHAIENE